MANAVLIIVIILIILVIIGIGIYFWRKNKVPSLYIPPASVTNNGIDTSYHITVAKDPSTTYTSPACYIGADTSTGYAFITLNKGEGLLVSSSKPINKIYPTAVPSVTLGGGQTLGYKNGVLYLNGIATEIVNYTAATISYRMKLSPGECTTSF